MFKKYMHVERFGNDEVQGIELGQCYVFPKLDGTNASVWLENGAVCCGSRKRKLEIGNDNAGFCGWINSQYRYFEFLKDHSHWRLFGEWLVPHSLRTYRENAWRRFYVFDVLDDDIDEYLDYDQYSEDLLEAGIDVIPPICIIKNASYENLIHELENNVFLIQEGRGYGEGIVIKNYDYQNRFGKTVWAKIVSNQFKEKHVKTMGATVKNVKELIESVIVEEFVTKHLVDKTYAKIVNEMEGWNSRYIPRLLGTVYYDLINEESWNFIKKFKNPTINFKRLNQLCILKIKELKPELF